MHIVGFLLSLQYEEKTDSNLEKICRIPARPWITTENYLSARTRYRRLLHQLKQGGFIMHARPNGHVPHHERPTIPNSQLDFVHSEIGASADLRMDKVTFNG